MSVFDHERFNMPCRVEDRVGNRGDVIKDPWYTRSGWMVRVMWSDLNNPTADGVTDERIVNLTIL